MKSHLYHCHRARIDVSFRDYWVSLSRKFSTGDEGVCISTIQSGVKIYYVDIDKISVTMSLPIMGTWTSFESIITAQAASIVGWNVQSTAFSTSNSITSQINSNVVTSSSTQTSFSRSANGYEMSNGAKAGIGVAVGMGILIFITLVAWAIILRRRNRNLSAKIEISKNSQTQSNSTDSNDVFNLFQSCEHCSSRSHELDHGNICELGGSQINELGPVTFPIESSVATPRTSNAG